MIYSIFASLGKVALLGISAVTNQAILGVFHIKEKITRSFLRYWLNHYENIVRLISTSNTQDNINATKVKNINVILPPLSEQRAIANFLDHQTTKIDTLIAKKERLIELLEEKRTALISQVVTKGLNPDVEMKASGIPAVGDVPQHWDVEKNKKIYFEYQNRSETGNEELLTVSHLSGITPRSEKDVYMFMAESMEGYKRCFPGDLVINTMWAWMGALSISGYEGIVSPSYHVYRLIDEKLFNPKFLDYFYRTPEYVVEINRFSKGVWKSRLRLYPTEFFEMTTIIPPKEEQDEIVSILEKEITQRDKIINKLRNSIELFQEHRSALISAAVTGKIDVREWEG